MNTPAQFENIILRTDAKGTSIVRLKDVARADLGRKDYSLRNVYNGKKATMIAVYQQPGANALDVSKQVNATMQAYTAEVWRSRFLAGGVTGSIDHSGITKMEQYDAPWARGRLNYPNGAAAKFGVIMLAAPGRLASITCSADPTAYDDHLADITNLLNWLRPL